MTVYNYKYIENRKWEDTASEISEMEAQGWELLNVIHNGAGAGLKLFQAWMRKPKSQFGLTSAFEAHLGCGYFLGSPRYLDNLYGGFLLVFLAKKIKSSFADAKRLTDIQTLIKCHTVRSISVIGQSRCQRYKQ